MAAAAERIWISMYFFLRNSSPLFSITRSSSFCVIHVSVNIKNNAEKDTTLLLFFLSKSPVRHVISFQIKPWVAFGLPYLLIELFYIGMPVVQTDVRKRSVYGHVIAKFSRMGRLPHFLKYGAPPTRGASLRTQRQVRITRKRASNSPVALVINKRFAALFFLLSFSIFHPASFPRRFSFSLGSWLHCRRRVFQVFESVVTTIRHETSLW